MNTPDTDCVGNATQSMIQNLTVMQSTDFSNREVFSRHPLEDYQMLYPLPEDSILVIATGILIL